MWILLIWINLPFGICAVCTSGDIYGVNDNNVEGHSHDEFLDSGTGNAHMLADSAYAIDCCGLVTQWQARVSRAGTIHFQIWRPTPTADEYTLVGENEYTVSTAEATSELLVGPTSIAASSQIYVQNNDRIGWWSSGQDQIWYWDKHETDNHPIYPLSRSTLDSGSPVDWSAATTNDNRRYTIQLTVESNASPTFTNLPDTSTSISELTNTGTITYTVSYTDSNPADVSSLSVSMTTNTYFEFDASTDEVKVKSSLVGAPNTINLDFTVTDRCGSTDSKTLTITVTYVPPTIHSLPSTANVSEGMTAKTLLHTLNVTDPTDAVNCNLATAGVPFLVEQISPTTDWGIYLQSNPSLDIDAQSDYTLTIDCDDSKDTVSATFVVNVTPNAPPTFINLENSTSVSTWSKYGSVVFEVLASDSPENEPLSFNMTCDPTPCPFLISASGVVTHTNVTYHIIPEYKLYVYVTDGSNLVGPSILTINITDINHLPVINNAPPGTSVSVAENSAIGASVFAVNATDEDADTLTYSLTSTPADGLNYFSIDSTTGLISVKNNIDFESITTTNFNLKIVVEDGNLTTTATIDIVITDQNEAPSLNQTSYSITGSEGPAGTAMSNAGFGVSDVDAGDSHNFSLSCTPDNFVIDPNNGTITYASSYDLDTGLQPSSVTCSVTVTDSGGLTDTALLLIEISAVNDNCPVFTNDPVSLLVSYGYAVGTTFGYATATDADIGVHGQITYSLNRSAPPGFYFDIISSTGLVYKAYDFPTNYSTGVTVTVYVTATDIGNCSDVATVFITVVPERFLTFIEDEKNVAWLIACGIALVLLIAVLLHVLVTTPGVCKTLFAFLRRRKRYKIHKRSAFRHDTPETLSTGIFTMTTNTSRWPTYTGRWPLNGANSGLENDWSTNMNYGGNREWIPSPISMDRGGQRQRVPSPIMMKKGVQSDMWPSRLNMSESPSGGWQQSGSIFRFWDRYY